MSEFVKWGMGLWLVARICEIWDGLVMGIYGGREWGSDGTPKKDIVLNLFLN
ncbi:hypothetical protein [Methylomonas lenta]|uniref:hypothetical protein n=1 Tax=Methylomonas lenta TaxID=980561 RepID=UPI000AFC54A9|nr:hypothetical protein [Methylomonas lenta]